MKLNFQSTPKEIGKNKLIIVATDNKVEFVSPATSKRLVEMRKKLHLDKIEHGDNFTATLYQIKKKVQSYDK